MLQAGCFILKTLSPLISVVGGDEKRLEFSFFWTNCPFKAELVTYYRLV